MVSLLLSYFVQVTFATLPCQIRHWVVPAAAGPWTHPKLVMGMFCSHGCKDMYCDMALRVFFDTAAVMYMADKTLPTQVCVRTVKGVPFLAIATVAVTECFHLKPQAESPGYSLKPVV